MMLYEPVAWGPDVDKDAVLDYVFAHQRMTKVDPAMAQQFRASAAELIGLTAGDLLNARPLEGVLEFVRSKRAKLSS